jgi:hypothetical protein
VISDLPNLCGIFICVNSQEEAVVSYSNNISRRYKELLKEPRTRDMAYFFYATLNDNDSPVIFRQLFKNKVIFEKLRLKQI